MLMFTAKLSKKKLITAVLIIAIIVCIIIIAAGRGDNEYRDAFSEEISVTNIKSNEDRVAFLSALGWEVDPIIVEMEEAVIPKEFGDTYKAYNKIQLEQGFDLLEYAGKRVKRYTYAVTNYPDIPDNVYADLIIYKDRVIGGDICCIASDGFMHSLIAR
ncbi:MAG: DUF4830 domain-containing protein [Clostridiales bacterium]|jgi:hypothetical protein|nr:DUF4830 domain-containing protein [Clostridiales bacterium]